ncbi:AAA family ATPase [Methylomonas sp. 11b]|uniref:AAA family ATPase n=1 Tax=Methylomonas sp. 11b TaxID=1168169 RepID=UPI00047E660E|nr:AAA family ATPase [Methylomonas sp. 11b]
MLALKRFLQQHGIKQAYVARKAGISPATMAQLLNKEIWPTTPARHQLQAEIASVLIKLGVESVDLMLFEAVPTAPTAETANENADNAAPTLTEEVADMLLRKQTLSPQAKKAFGLFRDPFTDDVLEPTDLFMTPDARAVREHLWSTAKFGGFLAIVGESGAGKSTLREDLEERIHRENAPIVVMAPYVLGMEDSDQKGKPLKSASIADAMIRALAPLENPKRTLESKAAQLHKLLKDSRRGGNSHVLIIEEAHGLHKQTLKHLKRFLELKDGMKPLVSIILIGQTELKTKLSESSPDVREVVQRCELVELPPLDAHLEGYLRFKFERVGADLAAIADPTALDAIRGRLIFSKSTTKTRETVSLMYPLMVNNLVTAAINQAALLGFDKLTADLIREV